MKKFFSTLILFFFVCFIYAQAGEWTWMNGDSAQLPIAHYGTQGVFDSLNTPPALYEACEWTDLQGNFWLFGGVDYNGALEYGDLWQFKPSINQWAWIKGPGIAEQAGVYGTQGVPSLTNNPGARAWGCMTWADLNNNLWLFGGIAFDANGAQNELNDLWKYDISTNEWTWMKGADTIHSSGVYGTIGVSSPTNTPPCMWENNGSWTDSNNNLWLFGGISYAHLNASLNTLWKYDISTNEWTWINGVNTGYTPAVYGIKGVASPTNNPGGRTVYCKWKDSNDNLWFFGGGYTNHQKNDLWKYSISTDEWTWMSGDSATIGNVELDSSMCIPAESNIPEGRYENRACWTRECDNLAMYGGYGTTGLHSDLWNYKIASGEWTLVSGDTVHGLPAVYGIKEVSSPNNRPAASGGAIGWKDNSGNLWLFGGNWGGNTMWRYVPDSICPNLCGETSIAEISNDKNNLSIYPNPFHTSCILQISSEFSNSELKIYNTLALLVRTEKVFRQTSHNLYRNELANGIYFLQLINENGKIANRKCIIE
ncbi:MAG TPA: kelch repeat-containing protein [Bacteroidia bacterium]|nr:kelch repeat-containing protein [Bacteroidia bacterium]